MVHVNVMPEEIDPTPADPKWIARVFLRDPDSLDELGKLHDVHRDVAKHPQSGALEEFRSRRDGGGPAYFECYPHRCEDLRRVLVDANRINDVRLIARRPVDAEFREL